jgi:hypothetical protein
MIKVYPHFIGRLGNNMFQIAACVGYAKRYGIDWGIKKGYVESGFNAYQVDKFFPNLPACDEHFRRHQEHKNNDTCSVHFTGLDNCWFNYHTIPFYPEGIQLAGFWQSWKYFEGAEQEVRDTLKLNTESWQGHISLHIRRGDYLQYSQSFPPIDMEYIRMAVKAIEDKGVECYHIHVFSDDKKWCEENIAQGLTGSRHLYFHEGDELKDLTDMASCEHHIISNSTLAWWGAWLDPNPDKIVVSPSCVRGNWFGLQSGVRQDVVDLLPPEWIQIKFR